MLTSYESELFHLGNHFSAYDIFGVSCKKQYNKFIYTFRVWAPSAISVGLISDFVGWETPVPLNKISSVGIWELIYCSDISLEGWVYDFRINSRLGIADKADPYARESRPDMRHTSVIRTENKFKWDDRPWLIERKRRIREKNGRYLATPINIYEMHIGSFMRRKSDNGYITYRELADILPSYLKSMGYTHVEFLPLAEYPYDGSWGYQVTAFFAPTSRFGTPDDLKFLINALHKSGIGVILDWVPAHFPKDKWGLFKFDGSPLYEYEDKLKRDSSWGTCYFDLGRCEVQSFLISNALYFLREFHIDGLRVDAVASMIYLDYDRETGEWEPNDDGTNINEEGIAFIRKLNAAVHSEFPDVLMIAEESAAHGKITAPIECGGLGFDLKWNMGFANDFYDYLSTDPYFRRDKHRALNFPIMYAFSEKYCLPISHDEIVHGKKSFIDKMFGSYSDKFREARAALLLMMTYPGKKLLFMGTEYAQFREWDFNSSLEWFMLDYPKHREFREFVAALNAFYLSHSELWEIDFSEDGFRWLLPDEEEKNSVAYQRYNSRGEFIDVLINFSGINQTLKIPIRNGRNLESIFKTGDDHEYQRVTLKRAQNKDYAEIELPPFFGVIMKETNKIFNKNKESNHVL